MLDRHGYRGISLIGQAAGNHLIKHHTCGIEIAAGVDMTAASLFRRDIVYRPQRLLGQRGLGGRGEACNAEIGHFQAAVPQDHHIMRLDIPWV